MTQDNQTTQKSGQTGTLIGTRKSIVDIIRNDSKITIPQIATRLGKNPRGIDKHMQKLRELDIIHRVGGDFGGHWEIVS